MIAVDHQEPAHSASRERVYNSRHIKLGSQHEVESCSVAGMRVCVCIFCCRPNRLRWEMDRGSQKSSAESESEPDHYVEDRGGEKIPLRCWRPFRRVAHPLGSRPKRAPHNSKLDA